MRSLSYLSGFIGAFIAYPIAERLEKRDVRTKVNELRRHFLLPFAERRRLAVEELVRFLEFAGEQVPYYKDLFAERRFVPGNIRKDTRFLEELPFLTKDIVQEQGNRLFSAPLESIKYHECRTSGSTGPSCMIYLDQEAADYSSAVTSYVRERIGKSHYLSELHFASRFPEAFPLKDRLKEHCKCLAMNRSNLFFDRLDAVGLEEIWRVLRRRRPYLVHGHPSTLYAVACHLAEKYGGGKAFEVFESSGELLTPQMREAIARHLQCRVVDRYGLTEFGIIAYQFGDDENGLQVLESEGWPESLPVDGLEGDHEIVFTGVRNRLMPLVRYRTGDLARLEERPDGFFLSDLVGRIHDTVPINGVVYASHYIQDLLDRVGCILDFQVDLRSSPPVLRLVPEAGADENKTIQRIRDWWSDGVEVRFVQHGDLVRVGPRAKFRRVVQA